MHECADCNAIMSVNDYIAAGNRCPSCRSVDVRALCDTIPPDYDSDDDNAHTGGAHLLDTHYAV